MFNNTDCANTTQYSPISFNMEYNGVVKNYTYQFDTYLSKIFNQALLDFEISQTDASKYEIRLNGKALFRSARLFDITDIKEGCVLILQPKQ